jgi:hypothetical protein
MIKKLIEKFFGKFCRCLETPIAPDVRICCLKVFAMNIQNSNTDVQNVNKQ